MCAGDAFVDNIITQNNLSPLYPLISAIIVLILVVVVNVEGLEVMYFLLSQLKSLCQVTLIPTLRLD